MSELKIRAEARTAALAICASIADRSAAGERAVAHILMARPRRGVWLVTWSRLPGLSLDAGRRMYSHILLPGWEYTVAEMATEMLDDLDHFALTGEQPKGATHDKRNRGPRRLPLGARRSLSQRSLPLARAFPA